MVKKGGDGMAQYRTVLTRHGEITYLLEKKRIKNLNLRLRGKGEIFLSVPMSCPASRADEFIQSRSIHLSTWEGNTEMRLHSNSINNT